MAKFRKTRSRKDLANGALRKGWSQNGKVEKFSLYVVTDQTAGGDTRHMCLEIDRNEAFEVLKHFAPLLATRANERLGQLKTPAEAMRELADLIEGKSPA